MVEVVLAAALEHFLKVLWVFGWPEGMGAICSHPNSRGSRDGRDDMPNIPATDVPDGSITNPSEACTHLAQSGMHRRHRRQRSAKVIQTIADLAPDAIFAREFNSKAYFSPS